MKFDFVSSQESWRGFRLNAAEPVVNSVYPTNKTSSHSKASMLFLGLFSQLQRPAYIWFIILTAVAFIDEKQTFAYFILVPLVVLILFSFAKESYRVFIYAREDAKLNKRSVRRWDGMIFDPVEAQKLKVGDLVLLDDEEIAPADLVLLVADGREHQCHVKLSEVTGESAFQEKKTLRAVEELCQSSELHKLQASVKVAQPEKDYSKFKGKLTLKDSYRAIELNMTSFIMKGSVVLTESKVICLVVYTGHECKIELNMRHGLQQRRKLERELDRYSLLLLGILLSLVLLSSLLNTFVSDHSSGFFRSLVLFSELYSAMLPVSLFVVVEILQVVQTCMSTQSLKSRGINYDLGAVDFVLADKTGTVTENSLSIRACLINGVNYMRRPEHTEADQEPQGARCSDSNTFKSDSLRYFGEFPTVPFYQICDEFEYSAELQLLGRALALCNSVQRNIDELFSTSPDELALISTGEELGVRLLTRDKAYCKVAVDDKEEIYNVIAEQIFSKQQQKSAIVLHQEDEDRALLLVKGSMEAMRGQLRVSEDADLTSMELYEMAISQEGMRTMVLGFRYLSMSELTDFTQKVNHARRAPLNTEARLISAFVTIDQDLELLAVLGIEDQVLPQTVNCINRLKKAGVKIWLVSGDTDSNVISAAKTSGVFPKDYPLVEVKGMTSAFECSKLLSNVINSKIYGQGINKTLVVSNNLRRRERKISLMLGKKKSILETFSQVDNAEVVLSNQPFFKTMSQGTKKTNCTKPFTPSNIKFCLSLDKLSFETAIEDEDCREMLVYVLATAEGVCFSKLLPDDKATVAKLLKKSFAQKPTVLGIGDGNSDIPMIEESHVGVGITASRSNKHSRICTFSDVRLDRFEQLADLVLVHGPAYRSGIIKVVHFFIYQNCLCSAIQFGFTFLTDYTPVMLINGSYAFTFNIIASAPVIYFAYFDKKKVELNLKSVFNYILLGVCQGFALLYLAVLAHWSPMSSKGHTETLTLLGTSVMLSSIATIYFQVMIESQSLTSGLIMSQIFGLGLLVSYSLLLFLTPVVSLELIGVGSMLIRSEMTVINICCSSLLCMVSSYSFYSYTSIFGQKTQTNSKFEKFRDSLASLFRISNVWRPSQEFKDFDMKWYSLCFYSNAVEVEYRKSYAPSAVNKLRVICIIMTVASLLSTLLVFYDEEVGFYGIGFGLAGIFTIITIFTYLPSFNTRLLLAIAVFSVLAFEIVTLVTFDRYGVIESPLITVTLFLLFNTHWLASFILSKVNMFIFIFGGCYYALTSDFSSSETVYFISTLLVLAIAISLIAASVSYEIEKSRRKEYQLIKTLDQSVEKSEAVLRFLLPDFVTRRVKEGVRYIAEEKSEVTVVFCDICEFDKLFTDYTSRDFIAFIDSLFQKFDLLCDSTGLVKIETVGKTYMACSGLADSEAEIGAHLQKISQARRAIELALNILSTVKEITMKDGSPLSVKIGINTGPVTAGVVGHHKPQFSLVGDTVNTASRMCSTLKEANSIQISEQTYKRMQLYSGLEFEQQKIEAKGKGCLDTYIVREKQELFIADSRIKSFNGSESSYIGGNSQDVNNNSSAYLLNSMACGRSSLLANSVSNFDAKKASTPQTRPSKIMRTITGFVDKIELLDLKCRETPAQAKFRKDRLNDNKKRIKLGLWTAFIVYIIFFVLSLGELFSLSDWTSVVMVANRLIEMIALGGLLFIFNKVYLKEKYSLFMCVLLILMAIDAILYLVLDLDTPTALVTLEIMFLILLLNHCSGVSINFNFFTGIIIVLIWLIPSLWLAKDFREQVMNSILGLFFAVVNFLGVYNRDKNLRNYFNLKMSSKKELLMGERLLTNLMPKWVLPDLLNEKAIIDQLSNVTLLYADIVGFTAWSSQNTPTEIVNMLSKMFTKFDKLCVEFECYKVHTIGDCYVVMSCVARENRDIYQEALNVLKFAAQMISVIQQFNIENDSDLNMRIGIHTGKVIAGIVGTNIVRYDIYGPDVLIANKMESGGCAGKINVSEVTRELIDFCLPGKFEYEFNTDIEAKAINKVYPSYYITVPEDLHDLELNNLQ